jgi:hypothetical protein
MFDGCMVRKTKVLEQDILNLVSNYVKDNLGYDIKLLIKPMDEIIDLSETPTKIILKDESEGAARFIELYGKDKFKYSAGDLFIFDDDCGLWTTDETFILKVAMKYKDDLGVYATTETKHRKMHRYLNMYSVDDDWLTRKAETSLGKLLFNNGYLDLHAGKWYSKEEYGFNPEIVFFEKINRDFPKFKDSEKIAEVKKMLFEDVFETKEAAEWLIFQLARALAGDIEIKKFFFGIGSSNGGKGVLTTALKKAIGGYFGEFNAGNFIAKKNSGADEGQKNRWALLLRYKRIIVSNEVSSKAPFDGTALKAYSAGGDSLTGRHHCGDEIQFVPHFLPFIFCNDVPHITPFDDGVDNRVRCLTFPYTFTTDTIAEDQKTRLKPANPEIKKIFDNPDYQNALLLLLIEKYNEFNDYQNYNKLDDEEKTEFKDYKNYIHYQKFNTYIEDDSEAAQYEVFEKEPLSVQKAKSEWFSTSSFEDIINEAYEITNDEKDFITCKELMEYFKLKGFEMSATKMGLELNKFLSIKGSVVKKIDKKAQNVRLGIRAITDDLAGVNMDVDGSL